MSHLVYGSNLSITTQEAHDALPKVKADTKAILNELDFGKYRFTETAVAKDVKGEYPSVFVGIAYDENKTVLKVFVSSEVKTRHAVVYKADLTSADAEPITICITEDEYYWTKSGKDLPEFKRDGVTYVKSFLQQTLKKYLDYIRWMEKSVIPFVPSTCLPIYGDAQALDNSGVSFPMAVIGRKDYYVVCVPEVNCMRADQVFQFKDASGIEITFRGTEVIKSSAGIKAVVRVF